jgi:transglutaminase-like putative cysteine protease
VVKRLRLFLPSIAAALLYAVMYATQRVPPTAQTVAIAGIVASALVSAVVTRADLRTHLSVILAIVSATASGLLRGGLTYGIAAAAFALIVAAALRPFPSAPASRAPAARRAGIVLAITTLVVAGGLIVVLPPLGERAERHLGGYFHDRASDQSNIGFSSRMPLGSMHHMLLNDAVVMRVYGKRPKYLRGAVLDRYERRLWWSTLDTPRTTVLANTPLPTTTTRVVIARGAAVAWGAEARWFLGQDACDLNSTSGFVSMDPAGIAHPEPVDVQDQIAWVSCAEPPAPKPAQADDLKLSRSIREVVVPISKEWTSGANTDREKLAAIEKHLRGYEYSLKVDWDWHVDPVIDFLKNQHKGHCELFASSFALLARASGIPARVVSGYRVSEESSIGDYAIVRQDNAHTWVEAWVDGAWQTYDPTPQSESFARRHGLVDHAIDWASAFVDRVGWTAIMLGSALAFALLLAARRWLPPLVRRLRGRRARGEKEDVAALPCLLALEAELAERGHTREPSEPLERFARRLVTSGEPWATNVADALRGYADYRYGSIGDEEAVVRAVEDAARSITSGGLRAFAP